MSKTPETRAQMRARGLTTKQVERTLRRRATAERTQGLMAHALLRKEDRRRAPHGVA